MTPGLDRLTRDIEQEIEAELQKTGIFYRVFGRAKSHESTSKKVKVKQYDSNRKMQDLIGIRVTLYFTDDLTFVYKSLRQKFNFLSETIDEAKESVFEPSRINLIFRLDEDKAYEVVDTVHPEFSCIDTTYEIQLRTVLSEGWHEVEHDLRYKCKEDWVNFSDLSRTLNGIYASLITSDWAILNIFETLSYQHFKNQNWPAMMRCKLRLRFKEENIHQRLRDILDKDANLAKELFKVDRMEFLNKYFSDGIRLPLTLSNAVFVINAYFLKSTAITEITPDFIKANKSLFP